MATYPLERESKVLTISDSVHNGINDDRTGPVLVEYLNEHGWTVTDKRVIADGIEPISNALAHMAYNLCGLIVTTGGTGFGPRDVTPEGTKRALDRSAPGLAEAMRAINPLGRLSRGVCGTRGRTLIVNLPGSPTGAIEMLDAIIDVCPHAVDLLCGRQFDHGDAHLAD